MAKSDKLQQNALDVKSLKKRYASGTEALKGIDLKIKEGEFVGLLGPNCAGKSTLNNTIMGLAKPTSRSATVFGHDVVTDYQEARKLCGLAPQEPNLDWFLTIEETLDFHGGYYGMRKAERKERIDELLEGIFAFLDQVIIQGYFIELGDFIWSVCFMCSYHSERWEYNLTNSAKLDPSEPELETKYCGSSLD